MKYMNWPSDLDENVKMILNKTISIKYCICPYISKHPKTLSIYFSLNHVIYIHMF